MVLEAIEDYLRGWRDGKAGMGGERVARGQYAIPWHRRRVVSGYPLPAIFVTAPDTANIYTNECGIYRGLEGADTRHESVNHSIGQWVQADVHTNTIESVWSLFKRSVVGSYHHLSVKHLPAYLDEMAFRYNNRENAYLFRDTLLRLIDADSMKYAELIAG